MENTVNNTGYTAMQWLERGVRNAIPRGKLEDGTPINTCPRWVAVKNAFACGSTFAGFLCKEFDLDPDEIISR